MLTVQIKPRNINGNGKIRAGQRATQTDINDRPTIHERKSRVGFILMNLPVLIVIKMSG